MQTKILKYIIQLFILFNIAHINCSSHSIIVISDANVNSSLANISKGNDDKAKVAKKLPPKIGNMELFNVADYTKKYAVGIDLGYGVFYDLKNDRKGSGNIFIYKRYQRQVEYGLTKDAYDELLIERRAIEKSDNVDTTYSIAKFDQLEFYKINFVTPPDINNEQFDCHLFITGYNKIYLKVLFYYSIGSEYADYETDIFMSSLVKFLNTD